MVNKEVSNTILIILCVVAVVLAIALFIIVIQNKSAKELSGELGESIMQNNEVEEKIPDDKLYVAATMQDRIGKNSAWCGTFQLVWNDMQDNLTNGTVTPLNGEKRVIIDNLNKQSFNSNSISENYYYKNWGEMSASLKNEIEKGIKDKFNEKSEILDLFDWTEEASDNAYFFYAMLKRDFKFQTKFDVLEKGEFGKTKDVEYFGIDAKTDKGVKNQVDVWYYENSKDCAVLINTKDTDKVLLVRNPQGNNFEEIYKNAKEKSEKYTGRFEFGEKDTLKVPNLKFDVLREYEELEGLEFVANTGLPYSIAKAIQSIQMELNSEGGKIKSEAGMAVLKSAIPPMAEEQRDFNFDEEFAIFFIEEGKEPYFAARISDINLFK